MVEKMKMQPLGDRLLVKRTEQETKTAGGIYIPDAAKEKGQEGIVVAAGPGKVTADGKTIPMAVTVGARVYFGKYSGTEIDPEYLIIPENDILAIIKS